VRAEVERSKPRSFTDLVVPVGCRALLTFEIIAGEMTVISAGVAEAAFPVAQHVEMARAFNVGHIRNLRSMAGADADPGRRFESMIGDTPALHAAKQLVAGCRSGPKPAVGRWGRPLWRVDLRLRRGQ
jgi:hypothetical protein